MYNRCLSPHRLHSCRALIGASIFISTIVLGTIILITRVTSKDIGMLWDVPSYAVKPEVLSCLLHVH